MTIQLGSEPEMVKVRRHRHHFRLRLVHRPEDERFVGFLVVVALAPGLAPDVGVVERSAMPWLEATKALELSDV